MLKLTVDQIFPRKRKDFIPSDASCYKVTGYTDNENMWEYICQIGMVKTQADYKVATSCLYKTPQINPMLPQQIIKPEIMQKKEQKDVLN